MNGSPAPGGPVPAGPPGAVTGLVYAVNAAWNALTYVYDPELYLDVVSLGLIYDVCDENGVIVVEMTLPPGCPASETLPGMARAAVTEAVGDATAPVEVRVVRDPPWSPAMIDDAAAAALAFRIR